MMLSEIITIKDIWPVAEALLVPMFSILGSVIAILLILLLIVKIIRSKK